MNRRDFLRGSVIATSTTALVLPSAGKGKAVANTPKLQFEEWPCPLIRDSEGHLRARLITVYASVLKRDGLLTEASLTSFVYGDKRERFGARVAEFFGATATAFDVCKPIDRDALAVAVNKPIWIKVRDGQIFPVFDAKFPVGWFSALA